MCATAIEMNFCDICNKKILENVLESIEKEKIIKSKTVTKVNVRRVRKSSCKESQLSNKMYFLSSSS